MVWLGIVRCDWYGLAKLSSTHLPGEILSLWLDHPFAKERAEPSPTGHLRICLYFYSFLLFLFHQLILLVLTICLVHAPGPPPRPLGAISTAGGGAARAARPPRPPWQAPQPREAGATSGSPEHSLPLLLSSLSPPGDDNDTVLMWETFLMRLL